ncbi:hypothetical protein EZV62_007676 [Acer yangbiense]|uniref:Glycosyltransferase n=1 Tax=Acer yangbiense TaxID=1000413 RepID=A0A5C7IBC1_9ROSI|nr:hypothetical protein EZV62_007676 [Acer yangbiense]
MKPGGICTDNFEISTMDSEDDDQQLVHVMFLPYMAPGHMMPMVDIARLFAANGIRVTIVVTAFNALRFKHVIDRDIESGRMIAIEILHFPYAESGLPEGCENLSSTPTPEMSIKLFHAIDLLQPHFEKLFRDHHPNCIVSDYLFPWTVKLATELGIPRLAFSGSGFFNLCVSHNIEIYKPHENIESETETFIIPGLPDQVKLTRSQLPDIVKTKTAFSAMFEQLKEAERNSFGVLMNSFYELEPAYVDHHRQHTGIKTWNLGPVALFNGGDTTTSISKHSCLSWLDSRKAKSVLYICFGSLARFSKAQLAEIASALEVSGHPFIWVVGKILDNEDENDDNQQQESWWLSDEEFEDRITKTERGLMIRGWAPQVLLLEHPSIGGFLTHCGWNSILEGVSAGVAMVTWPIFAEQFYNEKLITQVLKIGVSVGNETWKIWATQDSPLVERNKIKNAVCAVMGSSSSSSEEDVVVEVVEMRRRVNHLSKLAKKAVEIGGSSSIDLTALIKDIRLYKQTCQVVNA